MHKTTIFLKKKSQFGKYGRHKTSTFLKKKCQFRKYSGHKTTIFFKTFFNLECMVGMKQIYF